MYHAVITNEGRAWLEEPDATPLRRALRAVAEPLLEAEDPEAVFGAFQARIGERLGESLGEAALRDVWQQLGRAAVIKVRRLSGTGARPTYVLTDPPVGRYRKASDLGARRASAGSKPCGPNGRVRRSVTLAPDADAAVLAARRPGESYSERVERLIQRAARSS